MKTIINGTLIDGAVQNILIEGSTIRRITTETLPVDGATHVVDGRGTAAFPSLVNGHTHSPMVLLRGTGDDLPLHQWLTERMWPLEGLMTDEDYYWGSRLALAEMVSSGTGYFNEMYFGPRASLRALEALPMKACINFPIIDGMDEAAGRKQSHDCEEFFAEATPRRGIRLGIALHSVYTASRYSIEWVRDFSAEHKLPVHIHVAETEKEVADCRREHGGLSPVEYLGQVGLLSDRVVAAHTVHLSDRDIELLADYGVTVVHNPASNMKLASGVFPYRRLAERGVRILLGTDGAASNNNLDMIEEMKLAALLQKVHSGDPTVMSAEEVLRIATKAGADCFATGGGTVVEGAEADLMLVEITSPSMIPLWDLPSTLVYGASGANVRTVLSGGEVLMEDRVIPGFEEIRVQVEARARRLRELLPGGAPTGGGTSGRNSGDDDRDGDNRAVST